jgi:hypothetical protein
MRQNDSSSVRFAAVSLGIIIPPVSQNLPWREDRVRKAVNKRVTNGRLPVSAE